MCGRYFASEDFREQLEMMMRERGILPADSLKESGGRDVVPSNTAPVIYEEKEAPAGESLLRAAVMQWGFANPYRKGLIINARAETATGKNLFAESLEQRRCLIPASGFYEWDAHKARYRFTKPDGGLLLLAGFWHEEPEASGTPAVGTPASGTPGASGLVGQTGTPAAVRRFTILTTAANESMAPIHDRMPVMIDPEEIRPWLGDDSRLTEFLSRPQAGLTCQQDQGQMRIPGL